MVQFTFSWRWVSNMVETIVRSILGISGHFIGQKFLSTEISAFFHEWLALPPLYFFEKWKFSKKKFLFCLMSVHMSSGWQLIFWTMWYFSCFWGKKSSRCCKIQGFLNKTVHFPLEMVQKIYFEKLTINVNRIFFLVLLC